MALEGPYYPRGGPILPGILGPGGPIYGGPIIL